MNALPQPLPEPPAIAEPKDVDYPAVIQLQVDARDVERGIYHVHQTLPVSPGPLTLIYPQWLPGFHSPAAPIELLAGLVIEANGQPIAWRRDPVEVYVFHLLVPDGATALSVTFQYLSPTYKTQGRVTVTPQLMELQWNTVLLHPGGYFARDLPFDAVLQLPQGWEFACAIAGKRDGDRIIFDTAMLDVLVDSPLLAGRHFRRIELDPAVHLNLAADHPASLEIADDQIHQHRALIAEADLLFDARHYDHYDFLMVLSDEVGDIGVEHHRCCEISAKPELFTQWHSMTSRRGSMPHEYVHNWNGKFLRGADSWQPCFLKPIRNSLMWVYEGLTQYLGTVLGTRAGIWTVEDTKGSLASTAAKLTTRIGRRWRPLSDTTRDPIILGREPVPWSSWQRNEDYYQEGMFIWLDVDCLIREGSGGARSLDDFVAAFFGKHDGDWATKTYEMGDVTDALHQILEHDWSTYFRHRLHRKQAEPPLEGLGRGGYRLIYKSSRNSFAKNEDQISKMLNLTDSIGLMVGSTGEVSEVVWESPCFDAGITAGATIKGVNGQPFALSLLEKEVEATSEGKQLVLVVEGRGQITEKPLSYDLGARFPHLDTLEGRAQLLDRILAPRCRRKSEA